MENHWENRGFFVSEIDFEGIVRRIMEDGVVSREEAVKSVILALHSGTNEDKMARIEQLVANSKITSEHNPNAVFERKLRAHIMSPGMKDVIRQIRKDKDSFSRDKEDSIKLDFYKQFESSNEEPSNFFETTNPKSVFERFEHLERSCPNFSDVTGALVEDFYLSTLEKKPTPMPIFMLGPAGVGKTNFFNEFMYILDLNGCQFNLGSVDSSFRINGLNASWHRPCISDFAMITALCNGKTGALFFDEVNKCGGQADFERTSAKLPVLLSILEPNQAEHFQDNFLDATVDLRAWFKLLAAPSTSGVPYEILDRCRVIEVKMPTAEQQRGIVKKMAGEMPIPFTDDAIDQLNVLAVSLREIRVLVRRATFRALTANSDVVHPIHARAAVTEINGLDNFNLHAASKQMH